MLTIPTILHMDTAVFQHERLTVEKNDTDNTTKILKIQFSVFGKN